ncbi:MAG: periplasmic heavy metal sensor [Calditrichaeota bacterium]|nr:MAG: periplasmic heavy metal sensor [Calditrichota bacterium]
MSKKVFIILLGVLTLINVSAFGFWIYRKYAEPVPRRPMAHNMRRHNLLRSLGLTPEQTRAFHQSQRQFRLEADSLNRQLQIRRLALMDEILKKQPDLQKIDSLLQESQKLQGELERKLVEHLLRQKEFLTPEQQLALFRLMENRMRPRPGGWRRMPPP